jgi:hypothetical protein
MAPEPRFEFNSPGHTFSSAARNNSHLTCCSLSTRSHDSHAGGGMLDHSIRSPPPFPYHLSFMVGLTIGGVV